MAHLTLVWTEASESDEKLLNEAAAVEGAQLVKVLHHTLPTMILASLARGGVVYVATTAEDAGHALGLGADEVVRIGHMTRAAVGRALKRAAVRAEARAARAELESRTPDVGSVLSMLASVIGHEVNTPLSIAALTCEALSEGLPPMLEVQERLIGWATLAAPQPEFGRLMTTLAQQPSPSELRAMLADLRDGIERATKVAHLIGRLSTEERQAGRASVSAILADLHHLLRGQVGAHADVRVGAKGSCFVQVGRPTLVLCLAALLAHAVEAVRSLPNGDARIEVSASEHDDAVLVEIAHNGRPLSPDLRHGFLDPYFARASNRVVRELSVEGLQKRARLAGGELLVLNEGATTTLRLVLPPADVEINAGSHAPERGLDPDKRPID